MAENMDDNIKKAQAYRDSLDAINKTLENQSSRVGTLASEMGIAFGAWQSQTKKTQEDRLKEIKLLNDATKSVQGQKAAISEAFNNALKLDGAFKKIKTSPGPVTVMAARSPGGCRHLQGWGKDGPYTRP